MAYDPNTDPQIIAARKRVVECEAEARAKGAQLQQDHKLALAKGQTPEQIVARKRVVNVFWEQHLPHEKPEALQAFTARVDFTQPLVSMNARGIDVNDPKAKGFLGLGRKPAYLLSRQFPPHTDADPIYALEYFPVKT
jgi:hypothetical protein